MVQIQTQDRSFKIVNLDSSLLVRQTDRQTDSLLTAMIQQVSQVRSGPDQIAVWATPKSVSLIALEDSAPAIAPGTAPFASHITSPIRE